MEGLIKENQLLSKDSIKPVLESIVNELGYYLRLDSKYNPSSGNLGGIQDRSGLSANYEGSSENKAIIASSEDPKALETAVVNFKTQAERIMYEEMGNIVGEVFAFYLQNNPSGKIDSSKFVQSIIHQIARSTDSIYSLKLINHNLYISPSREQFIKSRPLLNTDTWLFRKVFEIKESLASGKAIEVSNDVRNAVLDMEESTLIYDINENKRKIEKTTIEIEKYDIGGEYFKDVLLVSFLDFLDDIDRNNASHVWNDEDRENPDLAIRDSVKYAEALSRVRGNANIARSTIRRLFGLYSKDNLDIESINKIRGVNLLLLLNSKGRSLLGVFMKNRGYLETDYIDLKCGDLADFIALKNASDNLRVGTAFISESDLAKGKMTREEVAKIIFKGVSVDDIDKNTGMIATQRIVDAFDSTLERLLESNETSHRVILESESSLEKVRKQRSEGPLLLK
ncbi:MAG: hypothetical protein WCK31_01895 [bacterium]